MLKHNFIFKIINIHLGVVYVIINIILCFFIFLFCTILLRKYKNLLIPLLLSGFIILFVYNLQSSIDAVISGLTLFAFSVFPTVFPFLILCNMLIAYDGILLYSKILGPLFCAPLNLSKSSSFPIAASLLCGYPIGAKYSTDLYMQNHITLNEYKRLINIATNCGPIFILGTVGTAMLGNIKYGYILLIGNYLSIYIMGFLLRDKKAKFVNIKEISQKPKRNLGDNLKLSIEGATSTVLSIGGFIILFSVIISIIKNNAYISIIFNNIESFFNLPSDSLYSLFLGSIEITNGCNIISSSNINLNLKLSLISFLCSFSGLCIIGQVSSVIDTNKISLLKYSALKIVQGIISFITTFFASKILLHSVDSQVISINSQKTFFYNNTIYYSIYILIIMMIIYVLGKIIRKKSLHIP